MLSTFHPTRCRVQGACSPLKGTSTTNHASSVRDGSSLIGSTRHVMGASCARQRCAAGRDELYGRTVWHMEAPSEVELQQVRSASLAQVPGDVVVHWQSSFGLIIIEARGDRTYVNGDLVEPAAPLDPMKSAS